jgi:hypothetical protein
MLGKGTLLLCLLVRVRNRSASEAATRAHMRVEWMYGLGLSCTLRA